MNGHPRRDMDVILRLSKATTDFLSFYIGFTMELLASFYNGTMELLASRILDLVLA